MIEGMTLRQLLPPRWEYVSTEDVEEVKRLGLDRWELVSVVFGTVQGNTTFYLKRPLDEPDDEPQASNQTE